MIVILKDGSEYCELCERKVDSRCHRCMIYKNKEKEETMSELIGLPIMTKEETVENLKTMIFGKQAFERFNAKERETLDRAITLIEKDRQTGHWEYVQYDSNPKIGNYHCSVCRHIIIPFENQKYCPDCGAKMEG